jgi:hypothetical protein
MEVTTFCGVVNCGVEILEDNPDGSVNWTSINPQVVFMSHNEWCSLYAFTDTGFEL